MLVYLHRNATRFKSSSCRVSLTWWSPPTPLAWESTKQKFALSCTMTILAALTDEDERTRATLLFRTIGAEPDRQATYQATSVYKATGLDPRHIDPLLVRLAEQNLLLYRAYSRGITLKIEAGLADGTH